MIICTTLHNFVFSIHIKNKIKTVQTAIPEKITASKTQLLT